MSEEVLLNPPSGENNATNSLELVREALRIEYAEQARQIRAMDRLRALLASPFFAVAISQGDATRAGEHLAYIVTVARAAYEGVQGPKDGALAIDGLVVALMEKFASNNKVIEAALQWALTSRAVLGELD